MILTELIFKYKLLKSNHRAYARKIFSSFKIGCHSRAGGNPAVRFLESKQKSFKYSL